MILQVLSPSPGSAQNPYWTCYESVQSEPHNKQEASNRQEPQSDRCLTESPS